MSDNTIERVDLVPVKRVTVVFFRAKILLKVEAGGDKNAYERWGGAGT